MRINRSYSILMVLVLALASLSVGCAAATEGEYNIQTVKGEISQIIRPQNGWVWTLTTVGDKYYDFDVKSETKNIKVLGSTKDNAGVTVEFGITYRPLLDDNSIKAHVRKFGLDPQVREGKLNTLLVGQVNTEAKNAMVDQNAYDLLANQSAVQTYVTNKLKEIFKNEMWVELESVQIIGRPDFVNDEIENAASRVVANQKAQEAAQAALAAARIEQDKKELEAKTFANPALLEIKKLELQLDIKRAEAEGIGKHNGPLTIINGQPPTGLQLRANQ